MLTQAPLDVGALHPLAAAVNQPDFGEAGLTRRVQVFLDDGPHVARCKRVQIDAVLDGDVNGFVFHCKLPIELQTAYPNSYLPTADC